ncbi:MAG TPA: DUF1697 domain-containing protein [Opitutus sp.]|nr:DUF1697 domain-containing protein [Opitutus sp.]
MPRYIAFLRGMNLGRRRIKMDALRALFAALGFDDVATFIASGNVLFTAKSRDEAKLARQIEQHLRDSLGYEVPTFLRTRTELAAALAFEPFPVTETSAAANIIHVGFWREAPSTATAGQLRTIRTEADAFAVNGREFYWRCRIPTHESKVWALPAMKALKLPPATLRSITMLRRLAAEFPAPAA